MVKLLKIRFIQDKENWDKVIRDFVIYDVYYTYEYCTSAARLEEGQAVLAYYLNDRGSVIYPFILRNIKSEIGERLFDIVTPYGYGGPLLIGKQDVLREFKSKFHNYCIKKNIVTEVIRLHPLLKNSEYLGDYCELQYIRKTTAVDLTTELLGIKGKYSSTNKRNIKRANKNGLTPVSVKKSDDNVKIFSKLYYGTMDRKQASSFYYFDYEFIEELLQDTKFSKTQLLFVYHEEKVISALIMFTTDKFAHYHLGASDGQYLSLRPNNLLFDFMIECAKEEGCEILHLGGGYQEDDNLFRYKTSFTNNINYDFYIGKNVFNLELYNQLIKSIGQNTKLKENYFPQYRGVNSK